VSNAPTLPQFSGGSLTDVQLNGLVTGITFATALGQKLANIGVMWASGTASLAASTSTSYVDVSGTSTSWTKTGDSSSSNVLVVLLMSAWTSVAATIPAFGVRLGGVDYDLVAKTINEASSHNTLTAVRTLTGIAAGSYSPNLRFKRNSGTGAVTIDTGDTVSYLLLEVPL
jgi:hypothetical protein